MMQVRVAGIGVLGPGLQGWAKSAPILRGETPYAAEPLVLSAPEILSGRERRRSSPTVRLALNAAHEAVDQAGIPAPDLAAVFGSSNGSGLEIHQILEALTKPEMPVSPTQFHNSVHNSAVGYWCIATSSHQPTTSIAAHDYTVPASILKAAAQSVTENRPVLLTVFDCPFPAPLDGKRHVVAPVAVALVLTPAAVPGARAMMSLSWRAGAGRGGDTRPRVSALSDLWTGNPVGRALPLLEALALGQPATIRLRYPANCRRCETLLGPGSEAVWDRTTKSATCVGCVDSPAFAGE